MDNKKIKKSNNNLKMEASNELAFNKKNVKAACERCDNVEENCENNNVDNNCK